MEQLRASLKKQKQKNNSVNKKIHATETGFIATYVND